jgi:hypothetical protein
MESLQIFLQSESLVSMMWIDRSVLRCAPSCSAIGDLDGS